MDCKPEKIWRYKPDGQGARHTTEKTFTDSVEYIRADLAKPSEWISGKDAVELFICHLIDHHEGQPVDELFLQMEYADLIRRHPKIING